MLLIVGANYDYMLWKSLNYIKAEEHFDVVKCISGSENNFATIFKELFKLINNSLFKNAKRNYRDTPAEE